MNGYIHNREELKPIHDEVASWAERSFVIGGIAHHKQQDLEQRIAKHVDPMLARIKELEEALETTCNVHDFICANLGDSPELSLLQYGNAAEHARAILNKR